MSKRSLEFSPEAWAQYKFWQTSGLKLLGKINDLLEDISRDPFRGIGKPEPLRDKLTGYWSRRINDEHRLVYKVEDARIIIIACRFHYDKIKR